MSGRVFVIGAGLAGLSAATALAARGARVTLFEAASQAGGRCRSYFDSGFDAVIDNGNHFILTGNRAAFAFLRRIGGEARMEGTVTQKAFFVDIRSGERWTISPNGGPVPLWLFDKTRRVPGTKPSDYLESLKLLGAGPSQRVCDVLSCKGVLWERLLRPFLLGALNTEPEQGSAWLAAALLRRTFLKGGDAYRIRIAHPHLASAFVDPALAYLKTKGAEIRFGARLRAVVSDERGAIALEFPDATQPLGRKDVVILAVPPWVATALIPGLEAPDEFRSIVNLHFKRPGPKEMPQMLGVIGGTAEWIFRFDDRISVTVSGADAIVDQEREALAAMIWQDVLAAYGLDEPMPQWQVVKEKRATFAATPAQNARRPGTRTQWRNLFLAGDWTRTGLPGTIEGAVQSGQKAAALALRQLSL